MRACRQDGGEHAVGRHGLAQLGGDGRDHPILRRAHQDFTACLVLRQVLLDGGDIALQTFRVALRLHLKVAHVGFRGGQVALAGRLDALQFRQTLVLVQQLGLLILQLCG
ncbi:hypothetical protein D3C72_1480600 [compost metagenome]